MKLALISIGVLVVVVSYAAADKGQQKGLKAGFSFQLGPQKGKGVQQNNGWGGGDGGKGASLSISIGPPKGQSKGKGWGRRRPKKRGRGWKRGKGWKPGPPPSKGGFNFRIPKFKIIPHKIRLRGFRLKLLKPKLIIRPPKLKVLWRNVHIGKTKGWRR